MIARFPALLAPLLLACPVLAEGRSDIFLDLAGRLPASLLTPGAEPNFAQIHFADHAAAEEVIRALPVRADPDPAARYGAYARLQTPLVLDGLDAGLSGAWEPLVGFGPQDIAASLLVKAPPGSSMLLRLTEGTAEVAPALTASGYAEETREGVTALVSNPEDFGIDIANRNPDNPFGGMMGSASRVAVEGSLLAQANNWPALLGLVGDGPKGHPDLAAMAEVLDRPGWGDAALLQAVLWPDQDAMARAPGGGIPPWDFALMADLAEGARTVTLVLFSYPDRAQAEAAAAHLESAWATAPIVSGRPMSEIAGAPAEAEVTGDGPFVTVLTLRAPADAVSGGFPVNGPFFRLLTAQARGDLSLFGPV